MVQISNLSPHQSHIWIVLILKISDWVNYQAHLTPTSGLLPSRDEISFSFLIELHLKKSDPIEQIAH